ncbi:MAG: hypothetical protein ACOZNI_17155 [Myxococcota bacterium]
MRTSSAIQVILVGLVLLVLAVPEGLLPGFLLRLGLDERRAELYGAWAATGCAALGFVLLVAGLFQYFTSRQTDEFFHPYREALTGLAAEYGQGIDSDPSRGLLFSAIRDGQRIDVCVSPRRSELWVTSPVVARQPLAWVRSDAPQAAPWREFKIVGSGRLWDLRAELPALARALLEDASLTDVIDAFFGTPEGDQILHRREGLELHARLAPPARLEKQVRNALDIAYRVRRANG